MARDFYVPCGADHHRPRFILDTGGPGPTLKLAFTNGH